MKRALYVIACAVLCVCVFMPRPALAGMVCPICKAEFNSRSELREHIATEHPNSKKELGIRDAISGHTCKRCGKYYQSKTQGLKHEAECSAPLPKEPKGKRDPSKTGHVCKRCGKVFPNDVIGLKHEATCTGSPDKPLRAPSDRDLKEADTPRTGGVGAPIRRPVAGPGDVTVVLKTGAKFVGIIESKSESSITLKTPEGAELSFSMDQVKEVVEGKGKAPR